jgi:hypothetical protein
MQGHFVYPTALLAGKREAAAASVREPVTPSMTDRSQLAPVQPSSFTQTPTAFRGAEVTPALSDLAHL